eukprot:TRINITY_DN35870_c0_g1_i2.p1 TRINITY_DN35870_c0_g1~~TRINITY_DN35870_c0_g1_i2.p1  ORF type:complete len:573 (-),score=155.84 TRINITY_DN35870_c0_g1_i2:575-2293(-)
MLRLALLSLFFVPCPALDLSAKAFARQQAKQDAWIANLEDSTKTPVQRVVFVLQKMKQDLEDEADTESEMYKQNDCWCKTNIAELKQAVEDANEKEKELQTLFETTLSLDSQYRLKMKHLLSDIEEMDTSLSDARRYRSDRHQENVAELEDLRDSLRLMRNAIKILKVQTAKNFMQLDSSVVSGLQVVLHHLALKNELLVANQQGTGRNQVQTSFLEVPSIGKSEGIAKQLLSALDVNAEEALNSLPLKFAKNLVAQTAETVNADEVGGSFIQTNDGLGSELGGSKEVIAVLESMVFNFEEDFTVLNNTETSDGEEFARLAKAKGDELSAARTKYGNMKAAFLENEQKMFGAKNDLRHLLLRRPKDENILKEIIQKCTKLERQWEERQKTRTDELLAVSQAMKVLTDDDNREQLQKGRETATSLLQLASLHGSNGQDGVERPGTTGFAKPDPFNPIYAALQRMVRDVKQEMAEEAKFREYCIKALQANELETQREKGKKDTQEARIKRQAVLQARLEKELEEVQSLDNKTRKELEAAHGVREQENGDFQTTIADQRAVQGILKKAFGQLTQT